MAIRILYVFLTFLGTFCDCEYREPNLAYLYRGNLFIYFSFKDEYNENLELKLLSIYKIYLYI